MICGTQQRIHARGHVLCVHVNGFALLANQVQGRSNLLELSKAIAHAVAGQNQGIYIRVLAEFFQAAHKFPKTHAACQEGRLCHG